VILVVSNQLIFVVLVVPWLRHRRKH